MDPVSDPPDPSGKAGADLRPDPLATIQEDVGSWTSSFVARNSTQVTKVPLPATRKTLYFLIALTVALLLNVFGVFLYVTFAEVVPVSVVWYLWLDGVISGIVIVYTFGLTRRLHEYLAFGETR